MPPENYDGNAFSERNHTDAQEFSQAGEAYTVGEAVAPLPPLDHGIAVSDVDEKSISASTEPVRGGSWLSSLFRSGGGFLSSFGLSRIGSEEILIIAVALFLFLSKDGDRECALMLLLLLIIN